MLSPLPLESPEQPLQLGIFSAIYPCDNHPDPNTVAEAVWDRADARQPPSAV